ncbi:MAG: hypothetical protein WKF47_14015 [Geodermatophilaceae bacterium]
MPDEGFLGKTTVARYAKALDDLPPADRDRRLQTLADFAGLCRARPRPDGRRDLR